MFRGSARPLHICMTFWNNQPNPLVTKSRSTPSARLSTNTHWIQTHRNHLRALTNKHTNPQTHRRTDGRYQVHYLPASQSIIKRDGRKISVMCDWLKKLSVKRDLDPPITPLISGLHQQVVLSITWWKRGLSKATYTCPSWREWNDNKWWDQKIPLQFSCAAPIFSFPEPVSQQKDTHYFVSDIFEEF